MNMRRFFQATPSYIILIVIGLFFFNPATLADSSEF